MNNKATYNKLACRKGILLYEALIAIVVLTFGITIAMRAFIYASKSRQLTDQYLSAIDLLESKIKEYESLKSVEAGAHEGTLEKKGRSYQWSIEIEALEESEDEEIENNFWIIHGEISWDQKRILSLDSIIYVASEEGELIGDNETTILQNLERGQP